MLMNEIGSRQRHHCLDLHSPAPARGRRIRARIIGTLGLALSNEGLYMKTSLGLIAVLISCAQIVAWADTCPPPPSSINPSVQASVKFDKKSGTYIYQYDLR